MNNRVKKKSGKISIIVKVAVFVLGLLILLYPMISNMWNQNRANKLIVQYDNSTSSQDDKSIPMDYSEALAAAYAYNELLVGAKVPDIFSIHEGQVDELYEETVNINGDGMMGYIEIPAIDVLLPVFHYTSEDVLQKGAGHILGSSMPVGGESTHSVLSAHRGLPSAKMFTDLDRLNNGDKFYIHVLGEILAYEIDQVLEVLPMEVDSLAIEKGQDYVTLVTCTPYAINTKRLLVRGHRIPYEEAEHAAEQAKTTAPSTISVLMEVLCVVVGIGIAVLIIVLMQKRQRKKLHKHEK